MTLNSTILSVTRRTKNGFTVGEIFDRIVNRGGRVPLYSTVRARVYELANDNQLVSTGVRKDSSTGRTATTFRRN
jgi:hypothetical protein